MCQKIGCQKIGDYKKAQIFRIIGNKIKHFWRKFEKIWKAHRKIQIRKSGHPAPTYTSSRISSNGGKNSEYPGKFSLTN
jgi:hypothetical protein